MYDMDEPLFCGHYYTRTNARQYSLAILPPAPT
jgi:hypothetical protein